MVLTVHRWFANKSCPGDYLYERQGDIAAEVTRRLNEEDEDMTQEKFDEMLNNYFKRLADEEASPSWELPAVLWAQENGILQGTGNGKMNPHSFITRGQVVTVLKRFYEKFVK